MRQSVTVSSDTSNFLTSAIDLLRSDGSNFSRARQLKTLGKGFCNVKLIDPIFFSFAPRYRAIVSQTVPLTILVLRPFLIMMRFLSVAVIKATWVNLPRQNGHYVTWQFAKTWLSTRLEENNRRAASRRRKRCMNFQNKIRFYTCEMIKNELFCWTTHRSRLFY